MAALVSKKPQLYPFTKLVVLKVVLAPAEMWLATYPALNPAVNVATQQLFALVVTEGDNPAAPEALPCASGIAPPTPKYETASATMVIIPEKLIEILFAPVGGLDK